MNDILIETERLIITEFTMEMAQVVQENSVDEDNKKYVPDEVWETVEEAEDTLRFLISQYGGCEGFSAGNCEKSWLIRNIRNLPCGQSCLTCCNGALWVYKCI